MTRVLQLEKRGCNFRNWENRCIITDIKNYRVTTTDYLLSKDGRRYFLEFTMSNGYRYHNKRTGELLKKPVWEPQTITFLCVDTCYETNNGYYRNTNIESEIHKMNLPYTCSGILRACDIIFGEGYYTAIEFVERCE